MRVIAIRDYGPADLLKEEEANYPKLKPKNVIVKVHVASLNPVDFKIRKGELRWVMGYKFPVVLGVDFAGVVEETGDSVKDFKPGDLVFGAAKIGARMMGAYAEYVSVPESSLMKIPHGVSPEWAACIPVAGTTALSGLKDVKAGEKVLIFGASGGVGSFAVQIATARGAHVTAFCGPSNIEYVKSLGVEEVFSYKQKDPTSLSRKFDLVFDVAGLLDFRRTLRILSRHGRFAFTGGNMESAMRWAATRFFSFGPKFHFAWADLKPSNYTEILDLVLAQKVKIHIENTYSRDEIRKAHQLMENGRTKGKSILKMQNS